MTQETAGFAAYRPDVGGVRQRRTQAGFGVAIRRYSKYPQPNQETIKREARALSMPTVANLSMPIKSLPPAPS